MIEKMKKILVIQLLFFVAFSTQLKADLIDNQIQIMPDYILRCTNNDSLIALLDRGDDLERISACVRMGQLGSSIFYNHLLNAFENEKYRAGLEIPYGVKYYSLLSIEKIKKAQAENLLINISKRHLININRPDIDYIADTMQVIYASFDALAYIGSNSAQFILDSIFSCDNIYWAIRDYANLNSMRISLADQKYSTKSDTAQFLFAKLDSVGGPHRQFDSNGNINMPFIIADNIRLLILQFRNWILPYLDEQIDKISKDKGISSMLLKLREDIINNPKQ
jgi:hypothetical protein